MHLSDGSRDELAAWATLAALRLPVNPQDVLDAFGGPLPLFQLSPSELQARLPWKASQLDRLLSIGRPAEMLKSLERLQEQGVSLIPFNDPAYPPLLRRISCPPAALWCRGRPEALRGPHVALVGSRRASPYGTRVATRLAEELVQAGLGVVSGGAYGIDAAAHSGALAAGGTSIAVLGTGIDQDYPAAHRQLFSRLSVIGACVSEFYPGAPPRPEHFPIRNRLISGLSLGVVVVEAGEKSGALITARFALEQNREVFAVPGDISSELSVGPHRLIQSGARLITGVRDVLEEIGSGLQEFPSTPAGIGAGSRRTAPELPPDATAIFTALSEVPRTVDELTGISQLEVVRVLEVLMMLELDGLVRQLPGQRFVRA